MVYAIESFADDAGAGVFVPRRLDPIILEGEANDEDRAYQR